MIRISRTIVFKKVIRATGRGMAVGVWGAAGKRLSGEKDGDMTKIGKCKKEAGNQE